MNAAVLMFLALAAPQDTSRLTLAAALRGALDRYPTIAAARASRDQAAAAVGEARAPLLPRLSLDAAVTRYELPSIIYPLHGLNLASPPEFGTSLAQGAATLSYTLWDFGGRANRLRAAQASEDAAGAALDASSAALVARVAGAYLRVLTIHGILAAQDQQLAALAAESDRIHRLLAAGRAARVEVLRMEATVSRARADREGTAASLDVAERDLAQLADVPVERARGEALEPLRLRDTTSTPDRDELLARARGANPELLQAQRGADAGRAQLAAARATRFPELRLQGSYVDRGTASAGWPPLAGLKGEWQAGVQLSYPLFTGGQRTSAIRRADADARLRAEQVRAAALQLEQSVDRALGAAREARARVAALTTAVAQFDEVVRIRRLTLETGSGTQTDYLDAETDLLRARASLVDARHAEIAAHVELARVTGELTPDWLGAALVADTRTRGPKRETP
jgi:outer membrane protein